MVYSIIKGRYIYILLKYKRGLFLSVYRPNYNLLRLVNIFAQILDLPNIGPYCISKLRMCIYNLHIYTHN